MQEEEVEEKTSSLLLNYLKFYFLKEDQLLIPGIIRKNRNFQYLSSDFLFSNVVSFYRVRQAH